MNIAIEPTQVNINNIRVVRTSVVVRSVASVDDMMRNILGHSSSQVIHHCIWNVKQCRFLLQATRLIVSAAIPMLFNLYQQDKLTIKTAAAVAEYALRMAHPEQCLEFLQVQVTFINPVLIFISVRSNRCRISGIAQNVTERD